MISVFMYLLLPVKTERYVNNRLTVALQVKASSCSSEQIPAPVPSGWKIKRSTDLLLHDLQFCRIQPVDCKTASSGRLCCQRRGRRFPRLQPEARSGMCAMVSGGLCVVDSASHYSLSCLLPQAEWFLGVEVLCSLGGNLIILLSKVKILPHTLLTEGWELLLLC